MIARSAARLALVLVPGGLLLHPMPLAAQSGTAAIVGQVSGADDSHGVDGAIVFVRGTVLRVRTDGGGRYRLPGLAPGRYTLDVLALGYQPDSVPGIEVAADATREVAIVLLPAPIGLSDIVVTAARAPEASRTSTASVTLLQAEEIVRRNVVTLNEALRYQPGVTFNGSDQMDIRGTSGIARGVGSRVLLLLDGHPILTGDGAEIDFTTIPMLDVDRVEVVKGAYSAVYGSNALGGVANVLTIPVGVRAATVVRLHGGIYQQQPQYRHSDETLNYQGFAVQHSRRLGRLGTRVDVGRETSDGYHENGFYSRWALRGKLTSAAASVHPWDLYAIATRETDGQSLVWRSDSEPYQVPLAAVGDYELNHRLLLGGSLVPLARPSALLRITPYVNYNSTQNYFHDNTDHHNATRIGANLQLSLAPSARRPLTLGVDAAHTTVHSNFLGTPRIADDAVFGQYDARSGSSVKASAGLRVDYHHATGGQPERTLSPKIGVVYSPTPQLSARASVGHGYRPPSAIEQFVSTSEFGFPVIPNPDLHGEEAWSSELGVTALPVAGLRLDAALFGSDFHDQIGPGPAPGQPFVFQFRNVSRARVRGLDVGVKSRPLGSLLDVEATYLFLYTKDLSTGLALPYRSRHNLTGTLNALHGLVGVDLRYRSPVQEVLVYQLDARKAVTVMDLRLNSRIKGTVLQVKVQNVFNTFYTDVQEKSPGAPRSLSITVFRDF